MDDAVWLSLAVVLTVLAGLWTWFVARRRGLPSVLRGVALMLLPVAAWLTGTLRMLARIVDVLIDWAVGLVFSPLVWAGFAVAAVAVLLIAVAGVLGRRGGGTRELPAAGVRREARPSDKGAPAIDDDLADIEALLRKHGIQ